MTDEFASGSEALAASARLHGAELGLSWSLPFIGLLLSIALFPLLAPRFWERHFGRIGAAWTLTFLLPCAIVFGGRTTATELLHTLALDFLPFIILLFALFVVAGGISVVGNLVGTPATNTALLAFGTLTASLFGTTGAGMLLIRPLIRANRDRRRNVHVFVFFIFLVCNIGGSLTPLGNPPLFLGFLKGVDFLWPTTALLRPTVITCSLLLIIFYAIDRLAWNKEGKEVRAKSKSGVHRQVRIEGLHNVLYLGGVVGLVLLSGLWNPGINIPIGLGIKIPVSGALRDGFLLVLSFLSWKTTRHSIRIENAFTWMPMQEVAILFGTIFITMIPVLAMLQAGRAGAFAPLLSLLSTPDGKPIEAAYFWLSGTLSSFLDSAPTYLVFFNLAGGNAKELTGLLEPTLLAISLGAVFMGANTYIGNAPNFMVRSICEERGVKMPSFFGFMLWSGVILLPLFLLLSLLMF